MVITLIIIAIVVTAAGIIIVKEYNRFVADGANVRHLINTVLSKPVRLAMIGRNNVELVSFPYIFKLEDGKFINNRKNDARQTTNEDIVFESRMMIRSVERHDPGNPQKRNYTEVSYISPTQFALREYSQHGEGKITGELSQVVNIV